MQGAGGLIFPPASYWPEVQRICAKYDVLLHLDEVITGFGRTGEWFGAHTYAIAPDIMTMAKGLSSGYQPISAISLGARMGETILTANEELVHGYTYSGHPVACAVALKNLEVIEKTGLVPRVKNSIGPYLQRRLRETFADHPMVGEVRGIGLARGHRIGARQDASAVLSRSRHGRHAIAATIVSEAGSSCARFATPWCCAPPLTVSEGEIEEIVAKAKRPSTTPRATTARCDAPCASDR